MDPLQIILVPNMHHLLHMRGAPCTGQGALPGAACTLCTTPFSLLPGFGVHPTVRTRIYIYPSMYSARAPWLLALSLRDEVGG